MAWKLANDPFVAAGLSRFSGLVVAYQPVLRAELELLVNGFGGKNGRGSISLGFVMVAKTEAHSPSQTKKTLWFPQFPCDPFTNNSNLLFQKGR
jgi:hypothetical protein